MFVLLALMIAQAEEVATVLVVSGDAVVIKADGSTPAVPGIPLEPTDRIKTDFESAVILHLSNDHLVRIDEDLELEIAKLVLLGAPKSDSDIKTQLADLLYPEERAGIANLDDAERVAGWHARLTASYTPGSVEYDFEEENIEGDLVAPSSENIASRHRGAPPEERAGRTTRGKTKSASEAAAPEPPKEEESAGSIDHVTSRFVAGGDLNACIVDWAKALPVDVTEVQVIVRVKNGVVSKVLVAGGLHADVCLRDPFAGKSVLADVNDGDYPVIVAVE